MKIGDYVQITRPTAPQFGEYGWIIRLRVGTEWWVRMEKPGNGRELSWRESSLEVVGSEYELACQILGEDYF
jgi:hypothetical protein